MNSLRKIKNKIVFISKRIPLMIKSLRKIYRYGGYTSITISNINHGQILKGKKILITGGGAGIGFSIAKKCIEEGATVVITGRNGNKLKDASEKLNSPLLKTLVWDISKISEIEKGVEETSLLLEGEIDILVNNAGVIDTIQFPEVTEEIWDRVYATNSKGLFFLTQFLCDKWMKNSKIQLKKVINISSQGGFVGATYPYRMTKWDIAGLTQGLGINLVSYGIIVNGIAPGIIATDMQPGLVDRGKNVFIGENPVQRFGLPGEIAELAVFLMSDAANFIVGQTIVCDGGYSIN